MNAMKAVAVVLVAALAFAALYPTIDAALPESWDEPPCTIELDDEGTINADADIDAMTFRISMPDVKFESNLPETIHDVKIEIIIGSGDCMLSAGSFEIGDVGPGEEVERSFTSENIPLLYFIAYAPNLDMGNNTIGLPVLMKTSMKYCDWIETQLLDFGMTVKTTGTESEGEIISTQHPTDTGYYSETMVLTDGGLVAGISKAIYEKIETFLPMLLIKGEGFRILSTFSDRGSMTNTVTGYGMTCTEALNAMLEKDGKITYTCNDKTFTIEGDTARAVVNAMAGYYRGMSE